jgi:hypothetical protein
MQCDPDVKKYSNCIYNYKLPQLLLGRSEAVALPVPVFARHASIVPDRFESWYRYASLGGIHC